MEILNTLEFAKRIPIDIPQFNILGAHPGNDIWNEFEAKGLLKVDEHWETGVGVCKISPTAVPSDEIRQITHNAFFQHMIRPTFLVCQIAKTLRSSYRINVIVNNLNRIAEIKEGANSVT